MPNRATNLARIASVMVAAATVAGTATPANADEPVLHQVRYTITTDKPFHADIYYRDTDPPNFADYSHDPYLFSPKVEADVGPDNPWVLDAMLANPDQWAIVMATSGVSPNPPGFHCELAVDGVVVVSNSGDKGTLCSVRHW